MYIIKIIRKGKMVLENINRKKANNLTKQENTNHHSPSKSMKGDKSAKILNFFKKLMKYKC